VATHLGKPGRLLITDPELALEIRELLRSAEAAES
jgi:hypothetical protein